MALSASGNWKTLATLEARLERLEAELDLAVTVRRGPLDESSQPAMAYAVDVVALDAPGLVNALADFFVVVDRAGNDRAVLRDNLAAVQTIQIAGDKARATVMSGTSSGSFRANREEIRMEMNHVDGIIMLEGGLPIEVAGSMIGAVGVSGAPGGDLDEECAQAALDSVQERLDFAM